MVNKERSVRIIPRIDVEGDNVVKGVKQGFSSPDASWFKGDSMDFVRQYLLEGEPRIYDLLDRTAVEGLVKQHIDGNQNRRLNIKMVKPMAKAHSGGPMGKFPPKSILKMEILLGNKVGILMATN